MKKLVTSVVIIVALCLATGPIASAQDDASGNDAVVQRLNEILNRLQAIEGRLDNLESEMKLATAWTVDRYGIMRDAAGHSIGFWGIDSIFRRPVVR